MSRGADSSGSWPRGYAPLRLLAANLPPAAIAASSRRASTVPAMQPGRPA